MENIEDRDQRSHDRVADTKSPPGKPSPFIWVRALEAGLSFRPITDADLPFLAGLYASTRMEELAITDWPEAQKAAFLQSQFDAQHTHYQKHYTGTDFLIVTQGDSAIGRLYLARWRAEHRIVDIALLPECRRKGLGAALLRDLLDEARSAGNAVTIHVEKFNPARDLYRRLGFFAAGEEGAYTLMRWESA